MTTAANEKVIGCKLLGVSRVQSEVAAQEVEDVLDRRQELLGALISAALSLAEGSVLDRMEITQSLRPICLSCWRSAAARELIEHRYGCRVERVREIILELCGTVTPIGKEEAADREKGRARGGIRARVSSDAAQYENLRCGVCGAEDDGFWYKRPVRETDHFELGPQQVTTSAPIVYGLGVRLIWTHLCESAKAAAKVRSAAAQTPADHLPKLLPLEQRPMMIDLLCFRCGVRGGNWLRGERAERPLENVGKSNHRTCADTAGTGFYEWTHCCADLSERLLRDVLGAALSAEGGAL